MKTFIYLTTIALFFSCGREESTTSSAGEAHTTVQALRATDRPLHAACAFTNPHIEIDKRLPNGLIAKIGAAGDTLGFQTYLNGTKHGPYFDYCGPEFTRRKNEKKADGFYIAGEKNGYFKRYRGPNDPQYISYYENGDFLWAGWYGWDMMGGLYPQKPMHLESKDSVFVEAPHPNGSIWFKGLYVDGKPKGVHKFYYSNGKKSGEINYYTKNITEIWGDENEDRNSYSFADDEVWYASK